MLRTPCRAIQLYTLYSYTAIQRYTLYTLYTPPLRESRQEPLVARAESAAERVALARHAIRRVAVQRHCPRKLYV